MLAALAAGVAGFEVSSAREVTLAGAFAAAVTDRESERGFERL